MNIPPNSHTRLIYNKAGCAVGIAHTPPVNQGKAYLMAKMAAEALSTGATFYVNGRMVRSAADVKSIAEGRF